jgi:DNA-binding PadR family transcriptional regulator
MNYGRTAYVVLGILAIEAGQSGYEIRKMIEGTVGFFWGESYGQLYPTLKRLTADGLITARRPKSGTRQEYSIAPAGRAALEQWLALPFRDDPPRDEFLLKLFFGHEAAPSVALAHLRDFQQKHREAVAMLEQIESVSRAVNSHLPGFPFWILTLTYGLARMRAELEWSETAVAAIALLEARGTTASLESGASPDSASPDSARES